MSDNQYLERPNRSIVNRSPTPIVESGVPVLEGVGTSMYGSMYRKTPLSTYWYVLLKHRWTIIVCTALITAIAALVSFFMTPVYKATTRLEIDSETPLLQSQSSDSYEKVDADDTFLQTEIQVLKSDDLAWQTIEDLRLAKHLGGVPSDGDAADNTQGPDKNKTRLIAAFHGHVAVEQVPKTRILSVSFEDRDPQVAAQAATKLVDCYLQYNFREKAEAIRRSGWLEQQLGSLKADVDKSQEALMNYEQQNHIVTSGDKQNILEQMLGDESHDLVSATADRIQKETLYKQVLDNRAQAASLVQDELLERLEEKTADLKQQYTQTIAQYGPNFPNAKRLRLEVSENEDQIRAEQDRVISRISNDYNEANAREKMIAAGVARQKDQVGKLNQLMVQDATLRHEFETNQQLYENVQQRLKDATVSAAVRSTNIHVVDTALPPDVPVRPRKLFNIVAALWAGIIIGIFAVFAREALDSSIKSVQEAEGLMLSPALGIIPFERGPWMKSRALLKHANRNQLALTLTKDPNSSLSEAFRALGTAISISSQSVKTLLITSAQSGEGKTTTALNLAQALAQRQGPILLIDCDLRKRELAKRIGIPPCKGLTAVLSGEADISSALIAVQPNLWVLAAGAVPADPVATLASQEMSALIEKAAAQFEFVIIDSPPVLAVTDATILSRLVGGVLLVTANGTTQCSGLMRARSVLEGAGAKIVGLAVNKVDPDHPDYRYSYSKYAQVMK